MGFTKTSEGRVFFKNPHNDDLPGQSDETDLGKTSQGDNAQMQLLLLLKTLNSKLKNTKSDQAELRSELIEYKKTIKNLEKKASEQEGNYIDLEQKVAMKQSEANKKSSRVEESVKKTLKQLEEAKKLVKELEEKEDSRTESIKALRDKIDEQRKHEQKILNRQKALESTQKAQGEKMVDNVAAYVALTKRVSESEARHEALDNKIEDVNSEYLKLDRKIDKAIEDRNRILRKVDRIEQAVLETRDALNAKAMVLLTDQGVAGVDMPQVTDETLKTDPTVLNRRLQEEAMMPWWRRPVRLQATTLVLMIAGVLFVGWLLNEMNSEPVQSLNERVVSSAAIESPPSYDSIETKVYKAQEEDELANRDFGAQTKYEPLDMPEEPPVEEAVPAEDDYGITIHRGYSDPENLENDTGVSKPIDVYDEQALAQAFEKSPERVARALNDIEPTSLTSEDMASPPADEQALATPPAAVKEEVLETKTTEQNDNSQYVAALKKRIQPDPNLTDVAKKIEQQAFEGVPEAQHDMGAIYVSGYENIPQDLERAVLWFNEAARNNVANAKYNLGVLYHQGIGVEQSLDKAIGLYSEASELNHPEAQYNLGIANIEGIGVPYNPERAAYYFEKAANEGVTEAAYNLGLIYENGLLGQTRPDDALAWYKTAADQGSPEAQSALDQLASSLGIGINDVNRIVEKLQSSKRTQNSNVPSIDQELTSQIQQELMDRGLYPGPVDGKIGPMTANAIRDFQRSVNLDVNGEPSQELLSYLRTSPVY